MKPKLLIVDDEPGIVDMLKSYFEPQYEVLTAYSGDEALRKVAAVPDLILLDIYLRKMNGYEVMEHMQKSPHLSKIPVILLTAAEQEDEEQSIASGAVDLIRKPFDPQMLLNRIEAVWKREAERVWDLVQAG